MGVYAGVTDSYLTQSDQTRVADAVKKYSLWSIGKEGDPGRTPALDLNFAENKSLVDDVSGSNLITFTRSSAATYVGADGLISIASTDTPRFDHDPETGESLGLLIEEERTNYIDNSNDLSQWNRVINGATTTSNTTETLSPDGTNNSTKITGVTNSGMSRDAIISVSASTFYTASVFAKKGSTDNFLIELGTGGNNIKTVFNINTKTFSFGSASGWFESYSTSYIDYPNGWVRVIISGTTSGSASGNLNLAVYGISSGYVYFWGAQAEQGSFPTSYIPTNGSTVTRAPDLTSITGNNLTSWYNVSEGSLYVDFKGEVPPGATGGYFGTNVYGWGVFSNGAYITNKGRTDFSPDRGNFNISNNQVSLYKGMISQSDIVGKTSYAVNGSLIATDVDRLGPYITPSGFSVSAADVGAANQTKGSFTVKRTMYWGVRLSNSTLQSLTQ